MSGIQQLGSFGSGILYATPSGSNATPLQIGALQDVSADLSRTVKSLYGQYQQPLATGGGELKASLKAKMGYINAAVYANLFYGVAISTGTVSLAQNEPHSVPASTPWTVTVTNGATFAKDLGVSYANGNPLTVVASGPTVGQYSVNTTTGVYTFATADANANVLISYEYTVAASGSTVTVGTVLQGVQPIITVDLYRGYNGTGERHRFWATTCSKLSIPTKMADFGISEMDFEAYVDSQGRFHTIYTD
jgi:hypothetical protein